MLYVRITLLSSQSPLPFSLFLSRLYNHNTLTWIVASTSAREDTTRYLPSASCRSLGHLLGLNTPQSLT